MKSFFDYIYYRITQIYFKWDGRTGGTAIVAVSMVQTLLLGNIVVFILRLIHEREATAPYARGISYVFGGILMMLVIYNYRKYNGRYNRYRLIWKDEARETRFMKGMLVLAFLIVPWMAMILIGVYW